MGKYIYMRCYDDQVNKEQEKLQKKIVKILTMEKLYTCITHSHVTYIQQTELIEGLSLHTHVP